MALALLADLCDADATAAGLAADDATLSLLTVRALRAEYGRLPFLLAGRIVARQRPAQVREALHRSGCGVPWLEPDLMALAVATQLDDGGERCAAEFAGLGLLAELTEAHLTHERRRLAETRTLLGCERGPEEQLSLVLWRLTLARSGATGPANWVREWLAAPPDGAPGTAGPGAAPAVVPRPWLPRVDNSWRPKARSKEEADGRTEFPDARDPVRLMGLLGAADVAVRAVRSAAGHHLADSDVESVGLRFVLHVTDVLTHARHRATF